MRKLALLTGCAMLTFELVLAPQRARADTVIPPNAIVQGNACIGRDCASGEVFVATPLKLKTGNTPAISFAQTTSAGFTAQTWDIGANEANFFVRDTTNGPTLPFRIRPGAPTSSIDIGPQGQILMSQITSAASKAAQTGPLQIVTSDGGGHLATNTAAGLGLASSTDISSINSQLGTINSRLGVIDTRLNDLDGRTTKALNGVSMAFAMSGVPWLETTERFAVSANWGTFQGTNGVALNAAMRLGTHAQANGGVAYGANGGGVGGRAGLRFGW